jgi:hypothetical protein
MGSGPIKFSPESHAACLLLHDLHRGIFDGHGLP